MGQEQLVNTQAELGDAQTDCILADLAKGCPRSTLPHDLLTLTKQCVDQGHDVAVEVGLEELGTTKRLSDELLQERHNAAKAWSHAKVAQNRAAELHDALRVAEETIKVYEEALAYSGELTTPI